MSHWRATATRARHWPSRGAHAANGAAQGRLGLNPSQDLAPEPVRFGGFLLGEREGTRHQDPGRLVHGRFVLCDPVVTVSRAGQAHPCRSHELLTRFCQARAIWLQASPVWSRARTTRPAAGGTQKRSATGRSPASGRGVPHPPGRCVARIRSASATAAGRPSRDRRGPPADHRAETHGRWPRGRWPCRA
jgi:hypothetical protein